MGVITIKIISKTSKTSHKGTTLGSAFAIVSSLFHHLKLNCKITLFLCQTIFPAFLAKINRVGKKIETLVALFDYSLLGLLLFDIYLIF